MLVALQLVGVAGVPLKVIVLAPCVVPKFVPAIITDVLTGPEFGVRLAMPGPAGFVVEELLELHPQTMRPAANAKESQSKCSASRGVVHEFERVRERAVALRCVGWRVNAFVMRLFGFMPLMLSCL